MLHTDVVSAIEENAVEGVRAWAAWSELELHEETDLTWTMTSIPFPFFNCVLSPRLSTDHAGRAIQESKVRTLERKVPIGWWIGPSPMPRDLGARLEAEGFEKIAAFSGMAVHLDKVNQDLRRPDDLRIQEVTDSQGCELWCETLATVHEFPHFAKRAWLRLYEELGCGPGRPWRHFLGMLEHMPVATSSLFVGAGVASIANVAVLPDVQSRGIGSAVSIDPLLEAHNSGYRVGTLWSSEMAEPMYHRLGFREYAKGPVYIWNP